MRSASAKKNRPPAFSSSAATARPVPLSRTSSFCTKPAIIRLAILNEIRTTELRQRAGQSITDVKLDLGCSLPLRQQAIVDYATRRRAAALVAATGVDRARISGWVAVDLRRAVEFSHDGANLETHLAADIARSCHHSTRRLGDTTRLPLCQRRSARPRRRGD